MVGLFAALRVLDRASWIFLFLAAVVAMACGVALGLRDLAGSL